ncbi:MAG: PIN domain-containing protein [Terracidiphilus sp.]
MTVFVMDASAMLRHIDNEAGADRVEAILQICLQGSAEAEIPAVQWGEIAGKLRKRTGALEQDRILKQVMALISRVVPATAERAVRAAALRIDRKMSNADSYAIELAMDSLDHVLVTADYDFKAVDDLARIEFLPAK